MSIVSDLRREKQKLTLTQRTWKKTVYTYDEII